MLNKLPPALVDKFELKQRIFNILKLILAITDDIFEKQLEILYPFNYSLLAILCFLASFVPVMVVNSLLSIGKTQKTFTDDDLYTRFVFNQDDVSAMNSMLLEL